MSSNNVMGHYRGFDYVTSGSATFAIPAKTPVKGCEHVSKSLIDQGLCDVMLVRVEKSKKILVVFYVCDAHGYCGKMVADFVGFASRHTLDAEMLVTRGGQWEKQA